MLNSFYDHLVILYCAVIIGFHSTLSLATIYDFKVQEVEASHAEFIIFNELDPFQSQGFEPRALKKDFILLSLIF